MTVGALLRMLTHTTGLTGSVTSAYESARRMERNGIVTGLDMTTEAAYTKLAFLLSQSDLRYGEIVKKMRQNLCGELTADFREEQKRRDSIGEKPRELNKYFDESEHVDAFVNT